MKPVIRYTSTDGSEWESEQDALTRDELDAAVRRIESLLPPKPRDSHQRVAIADDVALAAKTEVVKLCRAMFPSEAVFEHEPSEIHPMSYAGRFLGDVGGPLNRIWSWFMCYRDGFLYEQPYFALNPHQFEPE